MNPDEAVDMAKKQRLLHWDSRKKKFVKTTLAELSERKTGGSRKIRTESGEGSKDEDKEREDDGRCLDRDQHQQLRCLLVDASFSWLLLRGSFLNLFLVVFDRKMCGRPRLVPLLTPAFDAVVQVASVVVNGDRGCRNLSPMLLV